VAPTLAASELIARAKTEIGDAALRTDLIQLIETVIIYKLPRLTREEVQGMLKVHDIRETRVYQEGVEEGEGIGIEKAIAIAKLAAKKTPAAEIAVKLKLDVALVRKVIAAGAPKKGRK
jgi:predicted transposase YdaD